MIEQKVTCAVCGREMKRITNTHLASHGMSIAEYQAQFPNCPIDSPGLAASRVSHLRGKSYSDVYGEDRARALRQARAASANKQFTDVVQRTIRSARHKGKIVTEECKKKISEANTKHGKTSYRKRALAHYGLVCQRCGGEFPENRLIVHHKDFLNFGSVLGNHDLDNLMVLCKSCHGKLHNSLSEAQGRFTGISNVEKGMHLILKGLELDFGLDLSDENFKDTPKRVARAYAEIFAGVKDTDKQIAAVLGSSFPCETHDMVIAKDVRVYSMCPHHFLPVEYKVSIGYIPGSRVLGISKLARIAEIFAKRPVLQEQFTQDIVDALMSIDCSGAMCMVEGRHFCMIMRGVQQTGSATITSAIKGAFADAATRAEFMSLIK